MRYNISKELFESVMNIKINPEHHYICPVNIEETIKVWSSCYDYTIKTISFNDFFFRCKEWFANYKEIIIVSEFTLGNKYNGQATVRIDGKEEKYFEADSEQQAVFDACQWILENKGNK